MEAFDQKQYRNALGCFPTGVTVVTTRSSEGTPVGLTATSFNSVSMDPPLILWSLQNSSALMDCFKGHSHFAVHVLSEEQVDISQRFATRDIDRFDGTQWREGLDGVPVLPGCVAVFECSAYACHDGGDHQIFVGKVERFEAHDGDALAFYRSGYAGMNRDLDAPLD